MENIIGGIIFSIVGLTLIFFWILSFRNACRKIRTWKTVSGTITGYKEFFGQPGKPSSYLPQVQFTPDDGNMIAFTSSNGSGRRPYRIGATVKVLYAPDDPTKASIKSFSNLFLLSIVLVFFGTPFLGLGLAEIFFGPHR